MQLVAYGAQDVFLTGNPQISFFKVVYRRHTNFAMESIEQTFNGSVGFGNKVTSTISRNGDLISNMWLEVELAGHTNNDLANSFGHALIEYVELEIGGQRIDKHYGEYLEILSELTLPEEKRDGFKEMIGIRDVKSNTPENKRKFFVPLQFFFCRNPGLALPLIALQYHEVKINLKLRNSADLSSAGPSVPGFLASLDLKLFVDYIYLDTDERRRFAQMSHEYLIEQLQHTGSETTTEDNHRLNFNHPVKELIWITQEENTKNPMNFGKGVPLQTSTSSYDADIDYANISGDVFSRAKLQLNGHDRFSERDASYFRLVQPYQHHTRIPRKYIYTYSFALNPESHQPSGTCNFSRLDNVTLQLHELKSRAKRGSTNHKLLVYAINYNVLRIMSGMGGLAYSN